MLTFDWHLDLAWNALEWNRDLKLPVAEIRRREVERGYTGPGRGTNTVSLPALRDGHLAVVSATVLARHDRDWRPLGFIPKSGYESAEAANAMGRAQIAYYRALERGGQIRILTNWRGLDAHVREWHDHLSTSPSGPLPLPSGPLPPLPSDPLRPRSGPLPPWGGGDKKEGGRGPVRKGRRDKTDKR